IRYELADAKDNPLREVYEGYDLIVFANVSGIDLSGPMIGVGIDAKALMTAGLQADADLGALPDDAVCGMLVREHAAFLDTTGPTPAISNGLKASVTVQHAGTVTNIDTGVAIDELSVQYIKAQRAAVTSDDIKGLNDLAVQPLAGADTPAAHV